MADTYSTNLKVRLPQTGAYNNTWGAVINADAFQLLDDAIAGQSTIALGTSTTYSMAALGNGASSESRRQFLLVTGSPASAVTITIPATVTMKSFIVHNTCGQTVTFTYSGSTFTADVADDEIRLIRCDGTDVYPLSADASDSDALGGVASTYWARTGRTTAEISATTAVLNQYVEYVRNASDFVALTEGPTITIDTRRGNKFSVTLTGNRTLAAPTNPQDGQEIELWVVQDGTGGRTLSWNSVFLFENGTTPVLGTAGASIDVFKATYNSSLTKWAVRHFYNVTTGGVTTYSYTIDENTVDWNLLAKVGSPGGAITANVTVSAGVVVQALSTGTPAMDLSGLPAGSTVNLFNYGYILGKGGKGGNGAWAAVWRNSPDAAGGYQYADVGRNGGNAIKGPGSGITFNITNGSGYIWGGGGGGGGGGAGATFGGASDSAGGGGGGGAGGGEGGSILPAQVTSVSGGDGANGSTGVNGTYGAGGSAINNGGTGGAGGAGGDWGADGTAGSAGSGGILAAAGAAGSAGKAIELSGASAPTFVSGSGSPNVEGAVS